MKMGQDLEDCPRSDQTIEKPGAAALKCRSMPPSLGLDHIDLRVRDLDAVATFFTGTLGLPVSWPVRDEAFARYAWVNAGNVQLELWQARSNNDLPTETMLPCIAGLALWPQDIDQARLQLDAMGIACKEPRVWRTPTKDGSLAANFTNCLVHDASSAACQVFFCQWDAHAPLTPWPRGETATSRRARQTRELAEADGAIGVVGLHTIHMESSEPDASAHVWRCLTGAHNCAAPDIALSISRGPALRITALVLRVRTLSAAACALTEQGLDIVSDATVLWIDERATQGLRIGLSDL